MNRRGTIRQELPEFQMMNAAMKATNEALSKEPRKEDEEEPEPQPDEK